MDDLCPFLSTLCPESTESVWSNIPFLITNYSYETYVILL